MTWKETNTGVTVVELRCLTAQATTPKAQTTVCVPTVTRRTTDMAIYTCPDCASVNVFADAYVGVNDPDDVRTFSSFFCMDCEITTKHLNKEDN